MQPLVSIQIVVEEPRSSVYLHEIGNNFIILRFRPVILIILILITYFNYCLSKYCGIIYYITKYLNI